MARCELAVTLDTYLRSNRETAMIVVKDTFKGVIGLPPVSPHNGPLVAGPDTRAPVATGRSARLVIDARAERRNRSAAATGGRLPALPAGRPHPAPTASTV